MTIEILTGIPAAEQESSFMNATLQNASGTSDSPFAYSIAIYLPIPEEHRGTEEDIAAYLRSILAPLWKQTGMDVRVQIGREDDE